jgi:hypothetical protein
MFDRQEVRREGGAAAGGARLLFPEIARQGWKACECGSSRRWQTMNETLGRLLAVGNVAEIFEWGSCALKLYKSAEAKPAAFREAAIHAAAETLGLPVPKVWSVLAETRCGSGRSLRLARGPE